MYTQTIYVICVCIYKFHKMQTGENEIKKNSIPF